MKISERLLRSSIGKKYLLACTGSVLFTFVLIHLLGNLQIFLGPEAINNYAHFLQSKPGLVWASRLTLLAIVTIHVTMAIITARENSAARPVPYEYYKPVGASFASRTMLVGGLIVGSFIIYHLLHFTAQAFNPEWKSLHDAAGRHDVYRMVILGFKNPLASLFYITGVGLLSLHLSHGISSMFQTTGLRNKYYGRILEHLSKGIAILYFLGSCSMPVAVLTGLLK